MKEELSLEAATLQQLQNANSFRIYGHPLKQEAKSSSLMKEWLPIGVCFCVHDNTHPCPCMHHDVVFWLKNKSILEQGKSEKKDDNGNILYFYDIDMNAEISVQRIHNVKVTDLKKMGANLNAETIFGSGNIVGTEPTTIAFSVLGPLFGSIIAWAIADAIANPLSVEQWKKLAEQLAKDAAGKPK